MMEMNGEKSGLRRVLEHSDDLLATTNMFELRSDIRSMGIPSTKRMFLRLDARQVVQTDDRRRPRLGFSYLALSMLLLALSQRLLPLDLIFRFSTSTFDKMLLINFRIS